MYKLCKNPEECKRITNKFKKIILTRIDNIIQLQNQQNIFFGINKYYNRYFGTI